MNELFTRSRIAYELGITPFEVFNRLDELDIDPATRINGKDLYERSAIERIANRDGGQQSQQGNPLEQARSLMQRDRLNQSQAQQLMQAARVVELLPAPDGHDADGPFWDRAELVRWSQTAKRGRSAGHTFERRTTPAAIQQGRSLTYDPDARTFEGVVASEEPVMVYDLAYGEPVEEVLIIAGGIFDERLPVQDTHRRESTADTIGSMSDFHQEGNTIVGTGRLLPEGSFKADQAAMQIREGAITGLSLGYIVEEAEYIRPGETRIINGRIYTASDNMPLKVATRWRALEVSLVALPADRTCRIRADEFSLVGARTMPAIHSRNSVTQGPTTEECVAAIRMKVDPQCTDPSQAWYAEDPATMSYRKVQPSPALERICDRAEQWASKPLFELLKMAAESQGVRFERGTPRHMIVSRAIQTTPEVFDATVQSIVLSGFDETVDTTRWCSSVEVPKPVAKRQRFAAPNALTRRPLGTPAQHVDWNATAEETDAAAFAGQAFVDEQTVAELDGLVGPGEVPLRQLGISAARTVPDLVYGLLLSNPTMRDAVALFHASHANLSTSTALTFGNVQTVMAQIAAQSEGNTPLYLHSQFLVVPPALGATARDIARTMFVPDAGSTPNLSVIVEPRIAAAGIVDPSTGTTQTGSDTDWYMAAMTATHGIERRFLEGKGSRPEIRSWVSRKPGLWGMGFDVQLWAEAAALSWEGLAKAEA